jgi:hypothetical protein
MLDLPLEYALIGFEGDKFSGEIVPELLDLAGELIPDTETDMKIAMMRQ